jgi:hypothetical protein
MLRNLAMLSRGSLASFLPLLLGLAAALAPPAAAQAPKPGDYYEDEIVYGFRVKAPKGWSYSPPKPGEAQVIGLYAGGRFYPDPDYYVTEEYFLVAFDERPGADGKKPRLTYDSIQDFADKRLGGSKKWNVVEEDDLRVGGFDAVEYVLSGVSGPKSAEVGGYALVVQLAEGLKIGICANGPGERKWSKYETAYSRMAKTFQAMEVEGIDLSDVSMGASLRDQKRRELMEAIATQPGWRLLETENYFIISNSEDENFVEEVMHRIEAIRAVYEVDYPPEMARLSRVAEDGEAPEGEDGEDGEEDENRTVSARADPLELSRTSIVRVCGKHEDYLKYGAPPTSGGYWSSYHEELVVYNKKEVQGEDATFETLSHEAFHQYIYYFYGSLAPHSWYNEGTGDYYGGHEYRRKKFQRAPRKMRKDKIKEMLREERTIPLKEFVRWTKSQYYGENSYNLEGFDCYAQGWALVYFLRLEGDARGWNDAWEKILPTYLDVLASTGDLDEAIDKAFAGVDWAQFEAAWRSFVDKQL